LGARLADYSHCKIYFSDHVEASGSLSISNQGFHPDLPVPNKGMNKSARKD